MNDAAGKKRAQGRKNRVDNYVLEEQVGFILRQVSQRHTTIFFDEINDNLTPTQFSALVKLDEVGECSQNLLGRHTAMDAATIKGVTDRLKKRGLVDTVPDLEDKRRLLLTLTKQGKAVARSAAARGAEVTERTLAPLTVTQRNTLLKLLKKLK